MCPPGWGRVRGRAVTFTEPSRGARKGAKGWGRSPWPPQPYHSGAGWAVRLNNGFIGLIHSTAFTEPDSVPGTVMARDAKEQGVPTAKRTGSRGTTQREVVRESRAQSWGWRQQRGRAGPREAVRRRDLRRVWEEQPPSGTGAGRLSAPLPWAWRHPGHPTGTAPREHVGPTSSQPPCYRAQARWA